MSKWKFFTTAAWEDMYPFGSAHKHGKIRAGGLTLEARWANLAISFLTNSQQNIAEKVHELQTHGELNDRWLPSAAAFQTLLELPSGSNLYSGDIPLYRWKSKHEQESQRTIVHQKEVDLLHSPEQLFQRADEWILEDFQSLKSKPSWFVCDESRRPSHVTIIGNPSDIIMQEDVRLTACTLNTELGPIIIEQGGEVQEGSHLRGPLFIGRDSVIKMGTRIYGPTVIGPNCKIGGEVSNCVFLGFSNKGHDGFLGNSVIGHWCNLGADTNTSNLKSNYSKVKLWSASLQDFRATDLQFCGLIMGDHSKSGINTMFNTGTVVGMGCNIFGGGFQPKHIPHFSWGGGKDWSVHEIDKFLQTATEVVSRRGLEISEQERSEWRLFHIETTQGRRD